MNKATVYTQNATDSLPAAYQPQGASAYLDKLQVARLFLVTPRTIDQWMSKKLLPYYRIGRSIRFKLTDIESHLEQHCRVGSN